MNRIEEILNFWFEGVNDTTRIDNKAMPFKKWFMKDRKFDDQISKKFSEDLLKAKEGMYDDWKDDVYGRLALIILFDQFPRNIYRNAPNMFVFDPLAINIVIQSVEENIISNLDLIHRVFFYMPLMHAEDVDLQELCIQLFEQQVVESNEKSPQNTFYYEYNLDYAKKHYDIIKRFGRFPHRNAILKRESTKEEVEFLKGPNSSF